MVTRGPPSSSTTTPSSSSYVNVSAAAESQTCLDGTVSGYSQAETGSDPELTVPALDGAAEGASTGDAVGAGKGASVSIGEEGALVFGLTAAAEGATVGDAGAGVETAPDTFPDM